MIGFHMPLTLVLFIRLINGPILAFHFISYLFPLEKTFQLLDILTNISDLIMTLIIPVTMKFFLFVKNCLNNPK